MTAFKGYAPFYEDPREGVLDNGASSLRWAEQLLKGIRHDDPSLCAVALKHDGADAGVVVKKRGHGECFRFIPFFLLLLSLLPFFSFLLFLSPFFLPCFFLPIS